MSTKYEVYDLDLAYDFPDGGSSDTPDGGAPSGGAAPLSPDEALIQCLNEVGRVDMKRLKNLTGLSVDVLRRELKNAIFQDPAVINSLGRWRSDEGWLLRAQYCCGNIYEKLLVAEEMNERYRSRFDSNVEALKACLPTAQTMEDIHVSLGAPWIPPSVFETFLKQLLHLKGNIKVILNEESLTWKIVIPESCKSEVRNSVLNTLTYGTVDLSAIKIIEQTMNAKTVKVYDEQMTFGWNTERVLNREATLEAQEKQRLIIDRFDSWVRRDVTVRAMLEDCYNTAFAGYSYSPYDGSFLKLPDLNPQVKLYSYQRDAVARILLSPDNVFLAHDVGTGKTFEMCVGVHELYRMGKSHKNLVVVPNNVLSATVETHRRLYPDDKILVVYPKDFSPKYRNDVLKTVRDEEQVAVFMAYSSFNMITMSKQYWIDKMSAELKSLKNAVNCCTRKEEKRMLEGAVKRLEKKLSKYVVETDNTPWLNFDDLGVNTLVVDEAHNFKNIPLNTKTDGIVGLNTGGSTKCREMLEKCHFADRVIFASGTPLTNSLADLFVLQTYLQADELKFRHIDSFDMWINCFGQRETTVEVDVDSNSIREVTRFSSFHNLTELMCLFSNVCDFHHISDDDSELPKFSGYTDVCVKKSPGQDKYIKELGERAEAIRAHTVKRNVDNLLKVTNDGRSCALDLRLVKSDTPFKETGDNGKIEACAANIFKLYCEYPDTCQIVFSDIGTPKAGFNVYDELRKRLEAKGVPDYEIAYVHDATGETARIRLFEAINRGTIRVVIGSTSKLGVGVNVQERLIAAHHLSIPWRPSDMVQREGRILRKGNTMDEIFIFRYITEGSFDSYSWQLLQNKQRFISSFLSGTSAVRDADDIADAVLNYAEVKALAIGDPLVRQRVETSNRLERAKIAARQRQKQIQSLRSLIESAPRELENIMAAKAIIEKDEALYLKTKESVSQEERIAFGEELLEALRDNVMQEKSRIFDFYQGFNIVLPADMDKDAPYITVESENGGRYIVDIDTDKPLGCSMRIDRLLSDLTNRIKVMFDRISEIEKNTVSAKADVDRGNEHTAEVEALTEELERIDAILADNAKKSA
ncbi:MAG: DEAD/DEAH box helicase family protein [Clostridia bacterium]|nr:DEAD/DEAH box helicase family protein [Clostridia bacterium]